MQKPNKPPPYRCLKRVLKLILDNMNSTDRRRGGRACEQVNLSVEKEKSNNDKYGEVSEWCAEGVEMEEQVERRVRERVNKKEVMKRGELKGDRKESRKHWVIFGKW